MPSSKICIIASYNDMSRFEIWCEITLYKHTCTFSKNLIFNNIKTSPSHRQDTLDFLHFNEDNTNQVNCNKVMLYVAFSRELVFKQSLRFVHYNTLKGTHYYFITILLDNWFSLVSECECRVSLPTEK